MWSDENLGGVTQKQVKDGKIVKKRNNFFKIWYTVTSKQYAMFHLTV